jgi:hypothetical protein
MARGAGDANSSWNTVRAPSLPEVSSPGRVRGSPKTASAEETPLMMHLGPGEPKEGEPASPQQPLEHAVRLSATNGSAPSAPPGHWPVDVTPLS